MDLTGCPAWSKACFTTTPLRNASGCNPLVCSSRCLIVMLLNSGFFAYPRKKVQSRISSRLENDPLPLLSVFIDNMHVDEVQIDGGGTEAVNW